MTPEKRKLVIRYCVRVLVMLLVSLLILHLSVRETKIYTIDTSFAKMSTWVECRFFVKDQRAVTFAVRGVRQEFQKVETLCNIYNRDSELARLNASAADAPFVCSEELWEILCEARRYYEISQGAFDVTAGPLIRLWKNCGKENRMPDAGEITLAGNCTGMDKVVFDEDARSVFFTVQGMQIDLGGIAKGWALDKAAARLDGMAVADGKLAEDATFFEKADSWFRNQYTVLDRGLISVGGNVIVLAEPPPGKDSYAYNVRHPMRKDDSIASAQLLNAAVSTSADYERGIIINGKRYSHIVDPVAGVPVDNGILSVTVSTARGVDSDALSTAIFIRGIDFARKMKDHFPDMQVLIFYVDRDNPDELKHCMIGAWRLN